MATTTLSTVARANLRASKKKYILTGIGIAISSFFISAVLMLTSSLQATLDATIGDIYANSQNVVISAGAANQDDANSTAKFPMSNDTIKKLQESPEVSSSWILYSFSGTYGADKEKVTYASTPSSKDLAPFDIEGNLPSKDTELLVAKSFAEKHNLKIGDKVTMPNIVTSATDKDNAKDTEYTLTATFSTGISDSQMSDNVFIGGTSLADIARQLADEEGGIVSDPSKPMAPQAFIKLKNDTQESRDALQKELNTGDKNTTPKVFSNTQMMDHLKKQLSSLFDALGTILVAFAILALLVSSFVISNTFAVLVGTLVIGIVLTGHSVLSTSIAKELDRLYPVTAYAPFGESSVTNSSASVTKAKDVADKIKGLKNVEAVSVGSAAGVIEYTAKPDNAGSTNLKDNVMSLSNDDLHKVSTGESNINLKDDEVLVPQDIWDLGKFDNNTRLKLTGPLGTVEAKPIKAETKEPFFVVNPATGAKVQDASNPQPATTEQAMPEDPAAQEALMKAAKENPALARSFAARGTATMVLMRAKTPLTSSDNSQLQSDLAKANDGTEFQGGLRIRKSNDQTLSIMLNASLILLALAVVIAVIGVANTMTLSVNERRRENAMLRSLGLSRKQLRRMVSTEAVMITLGALAMGIVSGVLIGLVLSRVLVRSIRESMEMVPALPITGMVLVLVVGLLAAFAASAIPAFRSARQSPVEGLRSR